ncbi:MAG: RagB/SusD family nutrient uptake outer membrane protein [Lewinellaceae bacterium]|nr:RagB/SusD family nutrient uptake outer membrane protein [Lewinellaceae bacterium]
MNNSTTFSSRCLITAGILLLAVTGCQKEFLDRKPLGQLTYDTFFENGQQATEATNAVYNQLRQWDCIAFPWITCTDIISDDADKGSTPTDALYVLEVDDFTFDGTNSSFSGVWRGYYRVISRANLAILRIPDVPDMDPILQKRLIGECKFLRAYSYLLLVQWFGDVPIITEPLGGDSYYNQVRDNQSAVYDQIERDLLDAIDALPEKAQYASSNLGRASKGAARGMLAKLYMVKKDFPKAEEQCLAIINSNQYSLLTKYSDNFLRVGENGAESIFEVQAAALQPNDGVIGPGATPYNMIQGVRGVPNLGWGFNRPSDNFVASFENGDPRREATVIYVGEVLPDGATIVQDNPEIINERYNQKAWVPAHSGLQDNGPGNIRLLRYSDILLLAAEALNENNKPTEALMYLNLVRKRARGTNNFILPDVAITDQAMLREKIYKERRVELGMEQQRWFDLVRWGRAAEKMQAVGKNFVAGKHELLPVPQAEIDLTAGALKQNPGY